MPTDTDIRLDQLTDPNPPVPDDEARAAVHARATTLVRRRRFAQGGAAIACAAAIAIGAVALTSNGTTGHTGQVATASQPGDVAAPTPPAVSTLAPPTVAPDTSTAVADPEPANAGPAANTANAPDAGATDPGTPAPAEAALASATVSSASVPDDVNLTVTLVGDGGTFSTTIRTPGAASLDGVPPGNYELRWSWSSDDGTATAVGRSNVTLDGGTNSLTLN